MLIRKFHHCPEIVAGDHTRLRELLHPDRDYSFNGRYSLAHAALAPGRVSKKHRLKTDEVYFIISGSGRMHINDEVAQVEKGDAIDIPPGAIQWIENTGESELTFLCIVDPAWKADDEEILGQTDGC
ncbi:MAG: cupin domain-containing protein [Candidatus Zixiibacteriota bacterium]